jgi:hypothetical protein
MSRKKRHTGGKIVNYFFGAKSGMGGFESKKSARREPREGQNSDCNAPARREEGGSFRKKRGMDGAQRFKTYGPDQSILPAQDWGWAEALD